MLRLSTARRQDRRTEHANDGEGDGAVEKELVISVDEKSQIQALERTRPLLSLRPGIPKDPDMILAKAERCKEALLT